jgi:UDP-glucose 4-epimerase
MTLKGVICCQRILPDTRKGSINLKKIAIVGANSYIARNLFFLLSQSLENYEIHLYDKEEVHIDGGANYTSINILSEESVEKIDFSCDILFMFIGKTGSVNGFDQYDLFIDINERSLLNVLNAYRRNDSKAKIVFPSTRLVYKGMKGALSEDSQKEFKTIYAMNKFACEQYLEMYHHVYRIKYCILRICIPYGTLIANASSYGTVEFMLEKAMNSQSITLYGGGEVRRTVTYMGDLCDILIRVASSSSCENDVYNIGGENYSLYEMATLIAAKYGVSTENVPWPEEALKIESGDTVFDSRKLEAIIGKYEYYKFIDWCQA